MFDGGQEFLEKLTSLGDIDDIFLENLPKILNTMIFTLHRINGEELILFLLR